MPELPEVERAARRLARAARGKTIASVKAIHPALKRKLSPAQTRAVKGKRIDRIERRGKYQLLHLDSGDTLVVQTTGFRDDGWLDINGSPLTNAAKWTERFRRVNYGNLEIEITVDDPKAYTRPWTVKIDQSIMLDTDLIEFICSENDRSGPHLVGK